MEIKQGGMGKHTHVQQARLCVAGKEIAAYSMDNWNKVDGFTKFVCWILGKTTEVEVKHNGKNEKFIVIKASFAKNFNPSAMFITDKQVCEKLAQLSKNEVHAPTSKKDLLKKIETKKEMDKRHVAEPKQQELLNKIDQEKPLEKKDLPVDPKEVENAAHAIDGEMQEPSPSPQPARASATMATKQKSTSVEMSESRKRLNEAHPEGSIAWDANEGVIKEGLKRAYLNSDNKEQARQDIDKEGFKVVDGNKPGKEFNAARVAVKRK